MFYKISVHVFDIEGICEGKIGKW